jgi:DNA-binding PadR family transcriptional regulator
VKSDPNADLLTGEWAVLGVIAEAPSHGFAVARILAPDGELGTVWTMTRSLVYRAISDLATRGFLEPVGAARSAQGPARVIYTVTDAGRLALDTWLATPVDHVRHIRSNLLLKLALLHRRGKPAVRLLDKQRELLVPALTNLERALTVADGFDAVVLRYRVVSIRSALEFITDI